MMWALVWSNKVKFCRSDAFGDAVKVKSVVTDNTNEPRGPELIKIKVNTTVSILNKLKFKCNTRLSWLQTHCTYAVVLITFNWQVYIIIRIEYMLMGQRFYNVQRRNTHARVDFIDILPQRLGFSSVHVCGLVYPVHGSVYGHCGSVYGHLTF